MTLAKFYLKFYSLWRRTSLPTQRHAESAYHCIHLNLKKQVNNFGRRRINKTKQDCYPQRILLKSTPSQLNSVTSWINYYQAITTIKIHTCKASIHRCHAEQFYAGGIGWFSLISVIFGNFRECVFEISWAKTVAKAITAIHTERVWLFIHRMWKKDITLLIEMKGNYIKAGTEMLKMDFQV